MNSGFRPAPGVGGSLPRQAAIATGLAVASGLLGGAIPVLVGGLQVSSSLVFAGAGLATLLLGGGLFAVLTGGICRVRSRQAFFREAQFRAYFDAPGSGIAVTCPAKGWIEVNDEFCSLLGYGRDELRGKAWDELTHPDDRAAEDVAFARLASGQQGRFSMERRFLRKDGSWAWTVLSASAVRGPSGAVDHLVVVLTDLSRRKQVEAELREAKDAAEQASRAKSEFLTNMSHEVRTPLNGVLGLLALALRTRLTEEQREYVQTAHGSAQSLLHVLSDILDLSKVESGHLEIESVPFDLRAEVDRVARPFASRAIHKGLLFAVEVGPGVPPRFLGDPARIGQILSNLISNAVRFTDHGSVRVDVDATPADDGKVDVRVVVRDTGIGIAPDRIESVFRPFVQADNSITRRFGGTGLGLAICQQLAGRMGARLAVKSTPGVGSAFEVVLPLAVCGIGAAEAPVAIEQDRGDPPGPGTPRRVLLAEDNPVNRLLAVRLIEGAGHSVVTAGNGQEALDRLRVDDFDLVLMDLQMPVMGGLEAIQRIRVEESGTERHLRVVALTAQAMAGDRERCLDAGADAYLAKPFTPEALEAVIDGCQPGGNPVARLAPAEGAFQACRRCPATEMDECRRRAARPPVDLAHALASCGGDEALRRDVVNELLQSLAAERASLDGAVEGRDNLAVARAAHRMKSSLAAIGAFPAHEGAVGLERAAQEGDVPTAEAALRLACELDRLVHTLRGSFPEQRPR